MSDEFHRSPRSWYVKFRDAFRGLVQGVRGQNSFTVHFVCALLVVSLAGVLGVSRIEWSLLILCIFAVLSAEMFNTALETVAKAIDRRHNPHLADGLNVASAAVLVTSLGAVLVGTLIFGRHLLELL
jgi:diacylglycerol kinase